MKSPRSLMAAIRRSPFLDGMARLMDFEGVLIERTRKTSGFEEDARNLYGDWVRVGGYMYTAIQQVESEQNVQ
ncbi:MAG: hypothetical protein F4Z36_02150 [Acidimicrobiia bacterium]|nr:hypothetical protein [Acidimicrobiia bacterium]